jgi:hypothetical protein
MSGGSLGSRAARKALKRARREAHRKLIASSPDDRKLMTSSPADRKLMASSLAGRRRLPSRSPSQHRGNWAYLISKKIQMILVINRHKFSLFSMNSESAIKIVIASTGGAYIEQWTPHLSMLWLMYPVTDIWIGKSVPQNSNYNLYTTTELQFGKKRSLDPYKFSKPCIVFL